MAEGSNGNATGGWRAAFSQLNRWNEPDLKWLLLPPYEIPGMAIVSGVVVENRGRASAQNVKIHLTYPSGSDRLLHHMEIISDEPYIVRGGGDLHSFVTLRLRSLRPGGHIVIYYAAHDQTSPQIEVTSYQKSSWARVRASTSEDDEPARPEGEVEGAEQ